MTTAHKRERPKAAATASGPDIRIVHSKGNSDMNSVAPRTEMQQIDIDHLRDCIIDCKGVIAALLGQDLEELPSEDLYGCLRSAERTLIEMRGMC